MKKLEMNQQMVTPAMLVQMKKTANGQEMDTLAMEQQI